MDWPVRRTSAMSTPKSPPQPDRLPRLPSPLGSRQPNNSWTPQNRLSFDHPVPSASDIKKGQQLPSLSSLLSPPLSDTHQAPSQREIPKSTSSSLEPGLQPRPPFLHNPLNRDLDQRASPRFPSPSLPPTHIEARHSDYHSQRQHVSDYYQAQPYRQGIPAPPVQRPSSRTSVRSRLSDKASPSTLRESSIDPSSTSSKRRSDGSQRTATRVSRCLGKQQIDGEGMCYVYEDGSYCPTIIDGETVNPSWGITKAGKPRKRLAQACLTCREKKIKCDPAMPKCHQCAKSQRVCKGGLNETIQPLGKDDHYGAGAISPSKRPSPTHSAPTYATHGLPLDWERPTKMQRVGGDEFRPNGPIQHTPLPQDSWSRSGSVSTPHVPHARSFEAVNKPIKDERYHAATDAAPSRVQSAEQLALCLERDPSETDPALTNELLDLYFTHFSSSTYSLFPRDKFMHWLNVRRPKTQDDRTVLYCMLALGSMFSRSTDHQYVGRQFGDIATHALNGRLGRFNLQLAHARLILTMYYFAKGMREEAWDLCGSALRCISALRYNTEEGVHDMSESDCDYEFNRETLIECRRRTYWSGFLMDPQRFNGFTHANMCVFNLEDTFLRLPTHDTEYNSKRTSDPPVFDYENLDNKTADNTKLGPMAYLVEISAIWGDIFCTTARASHRPDKIYNNYYENYYVAANRRLHNWMSQLPVDLRDSTENLDNAITHGFAGTFLSIQALFHASFIRLNRHVRTSVLSNHQVRRNLSECILHADRLLNLTTALVRPNRDSRLSPRLAGPATYAFCTPFPGFAFTLAVDVISAGGRVSHLPSIQRAVRSGLDCVGELAEFWASARAQHRTIAQRMQELDTVMAEDQKHAMRQNTEGARWKFEHPLDTTYERGQDIIYGTSVDIFLGAAKDSEFATVH